MSSQNLHFADNLSLNFTDISQKTTDGGVSRPISRLAALASSGSIAFRRDKRRGYKYALSRRSLGEDGSPLFLLAKHDIAARSIRRLDHSFFKHGVKWWCGLTARTFCPCKTKSAKITFSKFNFLSLKNLREQMFFLFYGTAVKNYGMSVENREISGIFSLLDLKNQ